MKNSKNFREHVEWFIKKNELLEDGDKVLVGLSGGADSVLLLHTLTELEYECIAVHCNFHLRGKESQRDEMFVRNLCKKAGIELFVKDFETSIYATDNGISIEMAARELRYNYFEQLRRDVGADAIAVAHHSDDNVETILLNMVRGTGIKGMRGILPKNGFIIRPFLDISHDAIVRELNIIGQDYVNDSSNDVDLYNRNKIRLDVMPVLKSINISAASNIKKTIANMTEVCKVYEAAIRNDVRECGRREGNNIIINTKKLCSCVSPTSVLHEIISHLGFHRNQLEDILNGIENTGNIYTSKKWRLLVDREQLVIAPIRDNTVNYERHIRFAGSKGTLCIGSSSMMIEYEIVNRGTITSFATDNSIAYMDMDAIEGPLIIREVKEKDTFVPFGMRGRKLLSDYMTDLKMNRFEKESQMVMCDRNGEIIWVIGKRTSERMRVMNDTQKVVVLKIRPIDD